MIQCDAIPRYLVCWTDNYGKVYTSPYYLCHDDAEEHFEELVSDPDARQVALQEQVDGDVYLRRTWNPP